MEQDQKDKIIQACDTAVDFTDVYYASLDNKRHLMERLYLDNGTFVWNGNGLSGKDEIKKFFQELPPTVHKIQSLDSQPIDNSVCQQQTFLVQVGGLVTYEGNSPASRPFQQTFMITALADKWKIVSDCYRLQDELFK